MKSVGWRLFCLIALFTLVVAEEAVSSNDLKTDILENETSRSGAISEVAESAEANPDAEAKESSKTSDVAEVTASNEPSDTKRFMMDNFKYGNMPQNNLNYQQLLEPIPDQNDYNYAPTNQNVQNANQIITLNGLPSSDMSASQVVMSRPNGHAIRSGMDEDNKTNQDDAESQEAFSRLIPHSERIMLHKIPGANNLVTCSREGELHNFWSSAFQCLVCACIRDTGVLRPVCASCAGCMSQSPRIYPEIDVPNTPGSLITTFAPPIEEEVTCRPLPSGQPFDNPLHPCQVCICIESVNAFGKPDVHIKCEENPQCVLPTDVTVLPPIPDVPVPSPYCDKFPVNVLFPHPSDSCKTCRCSVQVSQFGVPEKQITCLPNPDCTPNPEIITEPPELIPNPPIPEPVPIYEIDVDPVPDSTLWPPATVPPHLGPLPGPSPHDSCRPYLPNQPFQHPWDECQMCVCTEAFAQKHITIEISCFTKKSCCVEPPFDIITPATLPPPKPSGKLRFQDALCEYKTFGVEFTHPKDPCNVCTCELQGNVITPFCKRSAKPECQLVAYATITPAFGEVTSDNKLNIPGSTNIYNAASSSQNMAIKNAFVSYPYGSNRLQAMGSAQSTADQHAESYNQWNLQNLQRPNEFRHKNVQIPGSIQLGSQNYPRPDSPLLYGSQNLVRPGNLHGYGSYTNPQGMGYSQYNSGQLGYQNKAYSQANHAGSGYLNQGQGYPGFQPGLSRPSEVITQAQTSAAASTSASAAAGLQSSYAYAPGYPGGQGLGYLGVQNLAKIQQQQFAQSSSSAAAQTQASSVTAVKYRGRSGNTDDNEQADKEN